MRIKIKKLHPYAVVPRYITPGASGFDLVAVEDVRLNPGETKLVKTGLSMDVGPGYELQIRPRSGLSLKTKFRVANSPGTVDSDFRGEIQVVAHHAGCSCAPDSTGPIEIKMGDRIAQGIIQAVEQATFEIVDELDDTNRGHGAFGSTGK
jgi:dUTP pyrophosphatase